MSTKQLICFWFTCQYFVHLFYFLTSTNLQLYHFLLFLMLWTTFTTLDFSYFSQDVDNCYNFGYFLLFSGCGQPPTVFFSTSLWLTWPWQHWTVYPGHFVDFHVSGHINFNYHHHFNWYGHGNTELHPQLVWINHHSSNYFNSYNHIQLSFSKLCSHAKFTKRNHVAVRYLRRT